MARAARSANPQPRSTIWRVFSRRFSPAEVRGCNIFTYKEDAMHRRVLAALVRRQPASARERAAEPRSVIVRVRYANVRGSGG